MHQQPQDDFGRGAGQSPARALRPALPEDRPYRVEQGLVAKDRVDPSQRRVQQGPGRPERPEHPEQHHLPQQPLPLPPPHHA